MQRTLTLTTTSSEVEMDVRLQPIITLEVTNEGDNAPSFLVLKGATDKKTNVWFDLATSVEEWDAILKYGSNPYQLLPGHSAIVQLNKLLYSYLALRMEGNTILTIKTL